MSYFTNFVRVPSAGKMGVVLEAITASLAATGRPGFITVPVSAAAPNNPRPGIISTLGGTATLDDIDAVQEALLQNATIMNRLDAIDAMCDRTHWTVSENLSGPLGTPSGYEPKVVGRTFMVAKPGKKQELVDALLGMRDKISSDVKPMLSTPLSGPISAVRITYISTSLQDLEDQRREFLGDRARNAGLPDLVGQVPIFHLGRVVYRASV
ncbi:MAG TPA: hypothetical protein EYN72_07860 [Dehalococcoidia bacterium]|jgi:hypothetical protein|nr:hypothetical protein [Dehalococcoidia bacterium]